MEYDISKQFEKTVYKLKDKTLKNRLLAIINKVAFAQSLEEIPNLTPMKGHSGFYRIKLGDYRVGISLENGIVWFLYFGKRDKSTYKNFP